MRKLISFLFALAVTVMVSFAASAAFADCMSVPGIPTIGTGCAVRFPPSAPPPSKGYTFVGADDYHTSTGGVTSIDYPVTMPGTAGRLIFEVFSQTVAISSVVYDPTGANVALALDYDGTSTCSGNPCGFYSVNVPAVSGSKVVRVTFASSVTFEAESGIGWLATGLTSGFDSAAASNITVNNGDLLFGANWAPAGLTTSNSWAANSTQVPTGNRLSTLLNGNTVQYSSSADWSAPSLGSFTAYYQAGATAGILATYK